MGSNAFSLSFLSVPVPRMSMKLGEIVPHRAACRIRRSIFLLLGFKSHLIETNLPTNNKSQLSITVFVPLSSFLRGRAKKDVTSMQSGLNQSSKALKRQHEPFLQSLKLIHVTSKALDELKTNLTSLTTLIVAAIEKNFQ